MNDSGENNSLLQNTATPEVIFQDGHYVAINKPANLLAHASIIDRHEKLNATSLLEEYLQKKVFNVHRLDKPTSGIMIFGLHSEAARKGMESFARADNKKVYLAVTRGYSELSGRVRTALPPVADKLLDKRRKQGRQTKSALTEFRRLATHELPVLISRYPTSRYSLLEVHPKTGRMHQIRRHLRQIRHPIIGDTKYGDHKHNRYFRDDLGLRRMFLAATELTFFHPFTNSPVTLTARLDEKFTDLIRKFGWQSSVPPEWMRS